MTSTEQDPERSHDDAVGSRPTEVGSGEIEEEGPATSTTNGSNLPLGQGVGTTRLHPDLFTCTMQLMRHLCEATGSDPRRSTTPCESVTPSHRREGGPSPDP